MRKRSEIVKSIGQHFLFDNEMRQCADSYGKEHFKYLSECFKF